MNERMRQELLNDYRKALEDESMKRLLGGILHQARINTPVTPGLSTEWTAWEAGYRALGLDVATLIREANEYGVAICERAYAAMVKEYGGGKRNGKRGGSGKPGFPGDPGAPGWDGFEPDDGDEGYAEDSGIPV